jgi:predicted O-methyltransferase YrrM
VKNKIRLGNIDVMAVAVTVILLAVYIQIFNFVNILSLKGIAFIILSTVAIASGRIAYRNLQFSLTSLEKRTKQQESIIKNYRSFYVNDIKSKIDLNEEKKRFHNLVQKKWHVDPEQIINEFTQSKFKVTFEERMKELRNRGVHTSSTSQFDREALFLTMRAMKPEVIVETGVRDGASTAHILEAIRLNGKGKLYSIDLPNENHPVEKAFLVPGELRLNWELIIGDSLNELPELLKRLTNIDLFFHDSRHTYDHMTFEYSQALKYLKPSGAITSHDVITAPFDKNALFEFGKNNNCYAESFRNYGIIIPTKS